MFNVNDYVFIRPTGDPHIDAFLGQKMIITDIIRTPYELLGTSMRMSYFNRYELTSNETGEKITVIDGEMEHCNA